MRELALKALFIPLKTFIRTFVKISRFKLSGLIRLYRIRSFRVLKEKSKFSTDSKAIFRIMGAGNRYNNEIPDNSKMRP